MTAQPLRNDNVYPLRMEDAIGVGDVQPENIPPASSTLAGALAMNEEAAKPKKPRKRKSATGRKRGRPVKKPITEIVEAVPELQTAAVATLHRVANGGESIASRVRRINGDTWLIVAACIAAIALGTSIAFLVIR